VVGAGQPFVGRSPVVGCEGPFVRTVDHRIDGGETTSANVTLLCTYHHRLLHEGGFSIVKEADGTLRFVTADGRTIPRCGYRREDFTDGPSSEGFSATTVDEVREPATDYCGATLRFLMSH
jgi:hypothetical protein